MGSGFPVRASAELSIFPACGRAVRTLFRLAPPRDGDPHPRHPVNVKITGPCAILSTINGAVAPPFTN